MSNLVIIGTQWGDEGKGKIVDLLSKNADAVVRFQGGHNAGHTLVVNNNIFKLSLLPSGIIQKKKSIIGNGVVIDPIHLVDEINEIRKKGIKINRNILSISRDCFLILPIHKNLDGLIENQKKTKQKIGTTGRGIGPAYEDKVARRGLRISDFENKKQFKEKFISIYDHHNTWIKKFTNKQLCYKSDLKSVEKCLNELIEYFDDTWYLLNKLFKKDKNILFEGAQGFYLDLDHGTYPYVTSSNTVASNASIGSGVGALSFNKVIGITKAYTTRVGYGPFPTEENNNIGKLLGKVGNEFGTVTGRKRRCGWLDVVMLKQAIIKSGVNSLVLTKLDVLDQFHEIKICTKYDINGKIFTYLPSNELLQMKIKPIYMTLPGWKKKTYAENIFSNLPKNAIRFIQKLEKLVNCKIEIISTGPDRDHTIIVNNSLN